jgi:ABC-type transporter MlaC component
MNLNLLRDKFYTTFQDYWKRNFFNKIKNYENKRNI